jgi:Exonuclease
MKILIVDTETDSPKPQEAQMLQCAIARLDLDTGETKLVFDSFIRPQGGNGWRNCWFLTNANIPEAVIEAAPPFSQVKAQVEEILQTAPVTAYNLAYDLQVLYRAGCFREQRPNVWPCLMLTCTPICKLPGKYGDRKYPKFIEAYSRFFPNEHFEEKHRAGYDVMQEAKLAYALDQKGYFSRKK